MEDEIEDIVGDVMLTDSQKSVAISNVYSPDFTDSSSERHNSSGKDTYVIEQDDSDTETFQLRNSKSVINLSIHKDKITQCDTTKKMSRAASTSLYGCSFVSQEIFTQTSKTIFELADIERNNRTDHAKTLETQTSFMSITNRTLEYRIEVSNTVQSSNSSTDERKNSYNCSEVELLAIDQNLSIDDGSSKLPVSGTENGRTDDDVSSGTEAKVLNILDEESRENVLSREEQNENSDFSTTISDIEEDSLMECFKQKEGSDSDTSEIPKSVDNDVEELYNKLSESINLHNLEGYNHQERRKFSSLTPLTEESAIKTDSLMDITPDVKNIVNSVEGDTDVLFTSNAGTRVKILPKEETNNEKTSFKLPPITNRSCPTSPRLNFLFSDSQSRPLTKTGTLPFVFEGHNEKNIERWEISEELASGENSLIGRRNDPAHNKKESLHLPPIHVEGHVTVKVNSDEKRNSSSPDPKRDPISVKQKIKELKMSRISTNCWMQGKCITSASNSRNASPSSGSPSRGSPNESSLGDAASHGCEVLCVELLRRLQSVSWVEVVDTLEELPKILDKFWGVITEHRITDLIRHVCSHVESPRTQVSRAACDTLASILKTTNYTKKPDFYEAVSILLTKTGSFSRPVRRAANVALDAIVSGVELSHAVTAICIHGVYHKSPLVRCAASRLLVVSCALAGGGRELLRARPQSAVSARRHALQALAAFLCDKNIETRKYAERLYSMLRPLTNFEAYYLTDVDVEVATRQMKKYDQLLLCGPPKANR